jgi:iron(III) transport system substrate-binding protein
LKTKNVLRRGRSPWIATLAAGFVLMGILAGCATQPSAARKVNKAAGGQVVVYTAGPKNLADQLARSFQRQTGVRVLMFQSTTGKVLGRLEAESAHPRADVVILADWSAGDYLMKQGLTYPYRPHQDGNAIWRGPGGNYVAYSASALGITYNTLLVKRPPAAWSSLTHARFRDKVLMPDPALSGSAVDFVGGYLQNHGDSLAFFRDLKANGAAVQGPNAEALDQVVTGAKSVVLAGVDYMAYAARAKGEPVNIVYPSSGTVVNPRPVLILKSAPDLANAEKFENFLLSRAGQQIVVKDYLLPGVKGIPAGPHRAPLAKIRQWSVDWSRLARQKARLVEQIDSLLG